LNRDLYTLSLGVEMFRYSVGLAVEKKWMQGGLFSYILLYSAVSILCGYRVIDAASESPKPSSFFSSWNRQKQSPLVYRKLLPKGVDKERRPFPIRSQELKQQKKVMLIRAVEKAIQEGKPAAAEARIKELEQLLDNKSPQSDRQRIAQLRYRVSQAFKSGYMVCQKSLLLQKEKNNELINQNQNLLTQLSSDPQDRGAVTSIDRASLPSDPEELKDRVIMLQRRVESGVASASQGASGSYSISSSGEMSSDSTLKERAIKEFGEEAVKQMIDDAPLKFGDIDQKAHFFRLVSGTLSDEDKADKDDKEPKDCEEELREARVKISVLQQAAKPQETSEESAEKEEQKVAKAQRTSVELEKAQRKIEELEDLLDNQEGILKASQEGREEDVKKFEEGLKMSQKDRDGQIEELQQCKNDIARLELERNQGNTSIAELQKKILQMEIRVERYDRQLQEKNQEIASLQATKKFSESITDSLQSLEEKGSDRGQCIVEIKTLAQKMDEQIKSIRNDHTQQLNQFEKQLQYIQGKYDQSSALIDRIAIGEGSQEDVKCAAKMVELEKTNVSLEERNVTLTNNINSKDASLSTIQTVLTELLGSYLKDNIMRLGAAEAATQASVDDIFNSIPAGQQTHFMQKIVGYFYPKLVPHTGQTKILKQ